MSKGLSKRLSVVIVGLAACTMGPDYDPMAYPDDLEEVTCAEAAILYRDLARILPCLRQEYSSAYAERNEIQTYSCLPGIDIDTLFNNERIAGATGDLGGAETKHLMLENKLKACGTLETVRRGI